MVVFSHLIYYCINGCTKLIISVIFAPNSIIPGTNFALSLSPSINDFNLPFLGISLLASSNSFYIYNARNT